MHPYSLAQIHLAPGEDERACDWMQATWDIRDPTLTLFRSPNPDLAARNGDARLFQLKKIVNLQ